MCPECQDPERKTQVRTHTDTSVTWRVMTPPPGPPLPPTHTPCPSTKAKGLFRTQAQNCLHFQESCLGEQPWILGHTLESPGELPKQR